MNGYHATMMRFARGALTAIVCWGLQASLPTAAAQDRYAKPDPFDACVLSLQRAVKPPPGGGRTPALLSLIELRDPELRPLYQTLLQRQDQPVLQADAVLGLAMTDPKGSLDPIVLRQIKDKALRSEVIKTLIGRDLLKATEINQILLWKDEILPQDRLFLVATLQRLEGAKGWQSSALADMGDTKVAELLALRALLLLEQGETQPWDDFGKELMQMTPAQRDTILSLVTPAVRAYRLNAAAGPLLRIATDREVNPNVRAALIGSVLDLDPPAGLAALRDEVSRDRSRSNLVRYGLLLLVVSDKAEVADFDAVTLPEEPELMRLADAGKAAKSGERFAESLSKLVDIGLRPAAEWAIAKAAARGGAEGTTVLNHVLDLSAGARDPRDGVLVLAVRAAQALIPLDPDGLKQRLLSAETPMPTRDAIMVALVDAGTPEAAAIASSVRETLSRRFGSMALITMAKAGSFPEELLPQLAVVASGGGAVEDALQAQAAWLYLKSIRRQKDALARVSPA